MSKSTAVNVKPVMVYLTPTQYNELKKASYNERKPASEIIRDLLDDKFTGGQRIRKTGAVLEKIFPKKSDDRIDL